MGPWYRSLTTAASSSATSSASTPTSTSLSLPLDSKLLAELESANEQELKRLDERLADAEKTEGETEISDALKAKANYLTRIGDKVNLYSVPFLREANLTSRTKPSPHKNSLSKRPPA